MSKFKLKDFKGIIPAHLTTFDENMKFDPKRSQELVDFAIEMGAGGLYLSGSNGMGPMMSVAERKEVIEVTMQQVADRVPVVVHVGAPSSCMAIDLAKYSEECGATGVSAVPPYYGVHNLDTVFEYYSRIAESTSLPFVIYAMSGYAGFTYNVETVQKLASITNVDGMKYTGPHHYMMGRIRNAMPDDFMMYAGSDEMMLSAQLMGVKDVIGGTYNVMPDIYAQAKSELWAGNTKQASKLILAANDIIEIFFPYTVANSMLECLRYMGVDAGFNRCPTPTMTAEQKKGFRKAMTKYAKESDIQNVRLLDALR
jgi:N-acetylneuraminate lyase